MKPAPKTIDDYILSQPEREQRVLQEMRMIIREAAPGAEEAMAYGIPTFRLGENLVHFGIAKNHLGFYPTPSGVAAFKDELKGYKTAKGSIQFPLDRPIPGELVARIVKFRIEETGERLP